MVERMSSKVTARNEVVDARKAAMAAQIPPLVIAAKMVCATVPESAGVPFQPA
jgi:hypothetical protein